MLPLEAAQKQSLCQLGVLSAMLVANISDRPRHSTYMYLTSFLTNLTMAAERSMNPRPK